MNGMKERGKENYKEFEASALYCNECGQAVPVRKRLLLILPSGNMFEYRCAYCGNSLGIKTDEGGVSV